MFYGMWQFSSKYNLMKNLIYVFNVMNLYRVYDASSKFLLFSNEISRDTMRWKQNTLMNFWTMTTLNYRIMSCTVTLKDVTRRIEPRKKNIKPIPLLLLKWSCVFVQNIISSIRVQPTRIKIRLFKPTPTKFFFWRWNVDPIFFMRF